MSVGVLVILQNMFHQILMMKGSPDQEYLKTMSKFHNYSFNNTLLIAMQRPDATLVTGYRNWQSMGRQVKKGEKGITIIAPAPIKRKKEQAVLDQDQKPVIGPDGKPKTEEVEVTLPCFKAITVFDIEQTTGEPIQTLAPEILTAAVEDFDLFLQAIREISPVPIRFDAIEGSANGYYHNLDKEIVIKKDMSQSQTLKTAIHETAHARLHDKEIMESQGIEKDRLTKEVEAESVAYCVCSAFELDTSEYSFPYIAGWSSGKEMRELKASMDVIRKTAGEMIDELTEKIEMMLEQKQEKLLAAVEAETCRTIYRRKASEYRENQTKRRKRRDTENQISKKKGGYELMSKVTFEEDELAVVALFQENTRKDTIDILKNTLEALEETKEDPLEDDLLETIASAINKLQMIEDKYYYSLDLNRYLNNLEDDAYEE